MSNVAVVEAVHNVCCEIKHCNKPFGNIPFIGVGDFRQVAPVIKGIGPTTTFDTCIKSSPLWLNFRIYSLHQPIRSASDPGYTKFVDDISENT